jgi:hypothetical protein
LLPERKCRDHGHGGTRKRGVDACGESKVGDGSMAAGSYGQIERQGRRLGTRVAVGGSCTNDGARKQGWRKYGSGGSTLWEGTRTARRCNIVKHGGGGQ